MVPLAKLTGVALVGGGGQSTTMTADDDRAPKSFLDFINAAPDSLPMLVYKAGKLPVCEVLEKGSDGGCFPEADDFFTIHEEWDWDAKYMLVITEGSPIPGRWLNKLERVSLDWIRVAPDSIKAMVAAAEPYLCIWRYHDGPRSWCQHGGDEDWTTIIKTHDYEEEYCPLLIESLSNWDHEGTEGDFTVITAAHA